MTAGVIVLLYDRDDRMSFWGITSYHVIEDFVLVCSPLSKCNTQSWVIFKERDLLFYSHGGLKSTQPGTHTGSGVGQSNCITLWIISPWEPHVRQEVERDSGVSLTLL